MVRPSVSSIQAQSKSEARDSDCFQSGLPFQFDNRKHRVLGTKGEVRVVGAQNAAHVEPDVVLYNEEHPEGKVYEHPVYKEHHGLLLQDFANTIL
jgi:hypothetical protein